MNPNEIHEKISLIADGYPFKLGNMTIQTTDSGKLLVTGCTTIIHFENISREQVSIDLKELKLTYYELYNSFNILETIIKSNNLIIEFHMAFNDGKASIGLCSEIDNELNWYID